MSNLVLVFIAGYASVFLLGFQSRCVNHGNFRYAACCSFLIAMMQTTLWGALFHDLSWAAGIAYGLSGATGITSSMFVHQRLAARIEAHRAATTKIGAVHESRNSRPKDGPQYGAEP